MIEPYDGCGEVARDLFFHVFSPEFSEVAAARSSFALSTFY
jgi:hypothetical protein